MLCGSSDGEQYACSMRFVAHVKRRSRVVTGPSKGSAAKGRPDLRLHGTKSYAQVAIRRKTGGKDLRLSLLEYAIGQNRSSSSSLDVRSSAEQGKLGEKIALQINKLLVSRISSDSSRTCPTAFRNQVEWNGSPCSVSTQKRNRTVLYCVRLGEMESGTYSHNTTKYFIHWSLNLIFHIKL
jgi:hypothetical protein